MNALPKFRLFAATATLGLLAACGGEAPADDTATAGAEEPAVIDERQANFEGIGDAFKLIRSELETGNPDVVAIENAATDMNERSQKIAGFFPEGTSVDDGFDTEALATIWEDKTGFESAAQDLTDASAEMITIAASGDTAAVGEQVKAVGGTCKGCHDKFRLDDD
ncbi:cytochrome c [Erythrobacter sp. F6033]|uniref:c-type cytochrome n=1 Tax=Erythrobacter sp. F6033 TaxID=2926401 RepID=UPI001FF6F0F6|nr:cytochrome c [Erythrobacter sp. F6033]MCK0127923.1 cytochrome c [Erythrobacter sp. F6033]